MEEKVIIIGGGVGPMAGIELHRRIIKNTLTDGTDQDHLSVYHISRSKDIVDRTEQLMGKVKGDAGAAMADSVIIAAEGLKIDNKKAVTGVPCNTFHSPEIFDSFTQRIHEHYPDIRIFHMIDETLSYINKTYPEADKIGLLSTTGTRKTGIYQNSLSSGGFEVVEIPEEMQDELHDSIYNTEWGIKATINVDSRVRNNFRKYVDLLIEKGAKAIILGCSEIPFVFPGLHYENVPLINPVTMLARAMINEVNPKKLQENINLL